MARAVSKAVSKSVSKDGAEAGFASLGPTLLARKGGAKPAMRPQLAPLPDTVTGLVPAQSSDLEDLGWNDMGDADERDAAPLTKSKNGTNATTNATAARRERKSHSKTTERVAKNKPGTQAKQPVRKAAFTLRLDPDRHLKLRLAATMHGISAQSLVTEALDAMFGDIEDLDALASRMKRN